MKSLILYTALSLFSVALAAAESEKNAIDTVIKQYETALNAGDVKSILNLYSQDPIFMPQHAPALIGRDAVKKAYQQVFNTIELKVAFETHEIEVVNNTAWARTSSSGKTKILASNGEVTEGNNELFIFKHTFDGWKIHRYLFATNQAR